MSMWTINPTWATCESRAPFVLNSLRHRAKELRTAANKCRRAYKKPFMNEPCQFIADAYDRAASEIEAAITQIETAAAIAKDRS